MGIVITSIQAELLDTSTCAKPYDRLISKWNIRFETYFPIQLTGKYVLHVLPDQVFPSYDTIVSLIETHMRTAISHNEPLTDCE